MSPRSSQQYKELRDASRQKILESSLELFGTKGYKSTTIADIVKKAGISKGLIYHYFDSKEDILKQLVDFFMEGGSAKVEEILKGTPKERLTAILDWFFHERQCDARRFIGRSRSVPKDAVARTHQATREH